MVQISWTAPAVQTTGTIITASIWNAQIPNNMSETAPGKAASLGDLFIGTGANAIKRLALGSARQFLRVNTGGTDLAYFDEDDLYPWLIDVDVFMTAITQTNWDTALQDGTMIFGGSKQSSGAQNDEIAFDVVLVAGTWTVEIMHATASDGGIYSVQFDGVEKGTIDGYSAGSVENVRDSVASIAVSDTGKVRLKFVMATKNASSSAYYGRLQHVQLRRTV